MSGWWNDAACRGLDTNLFYPGRGESVDEAKAVCNVCTVRDECLADALEHGDKFGIWGGTSEHERRPIRRDVKRARDITHGTLTGYRDHYRYNVLPVCKFCQDARSRWDEYAPSRAKDAS